MKVITAQKAASLIRDGSTVATAGFVGLGLAQYLFESIEERFLTTGSPRDLNLIWNNAMNTGLPGRGIDCLGRKGLIRRTVTSHYNLVPQIQALVDGNQIEAYVFPMGQIGQLFRETALGHPGLVTRIGIGTYVDPRQRGGRANEKTREALVELIHIDGQDYLFYRPIPLDVAIIRGTYADSHGNLSWEHEPALQEDLTFAMAAKHCGGIVIAQVEGLCELGQISPREVSVPGVLVDYVVVAPREKHPAILDAPAYDAASCNHRRVPLDASECIPLDERKIIARRAALELKKGDTVNLGLGVPECIASVAAEEHFSSQLSLTVEVGLIGGVPRGGKLFGISYNAEYITDTLRQVDWYESGGLSVAFLGAAEIDRQGNVNVSRFGKTIGPGGFINIASATSKVVFCGTFTAGGLELAVEEGRVRILREGAKRKFVADVEQITFSGRAAVEDRHTVLYITERAVFRLTAEGIELMELAPGIDLHTQVLDLIPFPVRVSPRLREMDPRIFADRPMGLVLPEA